MRSREERETVQHLVDAGLSDCAIARGTGVPRSTVRNWRTGRTPRLRAATASCPACGHVAHDPAVLPPAQYSYLLGLYLGDGHIAAHARGVHRLVVSLDARYPMIVAACAEAMGAVIGRPAGRRARQGSIDVSSYSRQWPCLFPQHGRGPKHERRIVLADWQRDIVDAQPEALLRGLIHSDGCRSTNTIHQNGKAYGYPRYLFSNRSQDIKDIFCAGCDAVGVEWRRMNAVAISVAKRASVARLDEFIGPKL